MTLRAAEGACAFAWRNYLLLNSGVSEDDATRATLHRYITSLSDSGQSDFGSLQKAAVAHLRKLHQPDEGNSEPSATDQGLSSSSSELRGEKFEV
jgi:hypothetical protein